MVDFENTLLKKCIRAIEEKLGWGNSSEWTNHDYEVLSSEIEKATKVKLSVATLKRIWGKVKYNSKPTLTTLDTLVNYIGYANWRDFKNKHAAETDSIEQPETHTKKKRMSFQKAMIVLLSLAILFILIYYAAQPAKTNSFKAEESNKKLFSFSSKKVVSEGVPNSVIFDYDASPADEKDTIFIQQSWDENLRKQVSKHDQHHTSIYYYPGFFQAKLIVNNKIVKEQALFIRTTGWLPLIEQKHVPVYFKEAEATQHGVLTLPLEKLKANGIALQPETPWVAFHNARTFGNLKSDNFIFETQVKNEYNDGAAICQQTEIQIRIEGGFLVVPLSIKGCVSSLILNDMKGRKPDPSPLGVDFSDWVTVRYEVKDRVGQIFINNHKAFDMNLDFPPVPIVGLLYRFQGTGSINFVKFSSTDGKTVYEDTF